MTSSDMGVHALNTGPVPRNKLLAELPEAAPAILLAEADLIVIPEGRIFWREGQPAATVYFPEDGLVCGVAEMTTGQ